MRVLLMLGAFVVWTAGKANAVSLTLDDCVERALKHNSGLKAFQVDVVTVGNEVKMAQAALLPSLRLKASYSLLDRPSRLIINKGSFSAGIPTEDVRITDRDENFYNMSLIVEQPLFTGGRLSHSVEKSKLIGEEAAKTEARQRKLLRGSVRKGFYELQNAQLLEEVARKVFDAKKERLRVLRERHKEGYVTNDDVKLAEADLGQNEVELLHAANRVKVAKTNLKNLVYLPASEDLQPVGRPTRITMNVSLDEVMTATLRNREELQIAEMRVIRADEDVAIAKSQYYPQAVLQGVYTQQKETNVVRPEVWMLVARLDWSLFEWGMTNADVGRRLAQKQRARYELEELQRAITLEGERAWLNVGEKVQKVDAQQMVVQANTVSLQKVRNRFEAGATKLVDVVEAESEFLTAFNRYLIAVNDVNAAVAELDMTVSDSFDHWFLSGEIYRPDVDLGTISLKQSHDVPRVEEAVVIPNTAAGENEPPQSPLRGMPSTREASSSDSTTSPDAAQGKVIRYVVQPREHLFRILTAKFGLSYPEANSLLPVIRQLNDLQNVDQIKAGDVLILPADKVKASKEQRQ